MIVSLCCWGPWHIEIFAKYGLPSLVAQLTSNDTIRLHTTSADVADLAAIGAGLPPNIEIVLDAKKLLSHGISGKSAQGYLFRQDFDIARKRGQVICQAWPDLVWGEGCFAHYRKLLKGGKTAIFQHFPRVLDSAPVAGVTKHRDLARIAIAHEHPIGKAQYVGSGRFPDHVEVINWRTPQGVLTRIMSVAPLIVDARVHDLNGLTQIVQDPGDGLAVVQDSDDAIGLSLAIESHEAELHQPKAFSIDQARAYLAKWGQRCSPRLASASYCLHDQDMNPGLWLDFEREASATVASIFREPALAA